METLRASSYIIPIKLEEEGKYALIHGYTGAVDIVGEDLMSKLLRHPFDKQLFSSELLNNLLKRGYITLKSKEEECNYVLRIARALHKRDKMFYSEFTWIVTYNCNFRCPYCFEKREAKDSKYSISFTKSMVDQTFDAMKELESLVLLQRNVVVLYGGEPLLKENKEIVKYIVEQGKRKGYKFHAITNGYDLDNFIDLLGQDLICRLQVTIDGTKDLHNQKRIHYKDSNSFDKIISNIQLILQVKPEIQISVRVNIDGHNLNDFAELKNYFREKGFLDNENFNVYSALVADNDNVSDKDRVNVISTKEYIHQQVKKNTVSSCNGYLSLYNKIYKAIKNKESIPLKATYCSSQTGGYVFSPLGEIYPCWEVVGRTEYQIGCLQNGSIKWNESELARWRSKDIGNSSCKHCRYAFFCGGGCQAMKGNHCAYFEELFKNVVIDVYKCVYADMFN